MALEVNSSLVYPDAMPVEVVERKGLGHPDTLVDGIVETAEIDYARYCLEHFGYIPHHNFDKATLLGGLCVQRYGTGDFEKPVTMEFMGRGSFSFGGEDIPLAEIQTAAAKRYLARLLPHLDISDPTVYRAASRTSSFSTRPHWFSPRSVDDLPEYAGPQPRANDTATMISYWPLTETERLALGLEGYFYTNNDQGMPEPRFPYFGQDIKVMAVRNGGLIRATLAVPQISRHTPDADTYFERLNAVQDALTDYARRLVGDTVGVEVNVNTSSRGADARPYLVTGGSCTDFGEEGAVGRGNKTHGIISSFRPNTMEAPHGKNPTYFVGKVLGYLADSIARRVSESYGTRSQVVMQADIGDNLFDPSRIVVSTEQDIAPELVEAVVADCLSLGRSTTDRIIGEAHFVPRAMAWKG